MAAKSDYESEDKWITVNGAHVKVDKGKTIDEAIKDKFGEPGITPKSANADNVVAQLNMNSSYLSTKAQVRNTKETSNERELMLSKVNERTQKKNNERLFRSQLQQVADGTFNKDSHLQLGETPNRLVELAGLPQLPLMMPYSKAYLSINKSGMIDGNYHDLGVGVLSQLPNSLYSPKYIFQHDNLKRVEVVVELKDKKGKNILTSVEFDTVGVADGERTRANMVITAFAPKGKNYIESRIAAGKTIYKK